MAISTSSPKSFQIFEKDLDDDKDDDEEVTGYCVGARVVFAPRLDIWILEGRRATESKQMQY